MLEVCPRCRGLEGDQRPQSKRDQAGDVTKVPRLAQQEFLQTGKAGMCLGTRSCPWCFPLPSPEPLHPKHTAGPLRASAAFPCARDNLEMLHQLEIFLQR